MNKETNKVNINGSGYSDPVAGRAINHVDTAAKKKDKKNKEKMDPDAVRFHILLRTIFNICELSGFHLEEHITVKDKTTGKIWR